MEQAQGRLLRWIAVFKFLKAALMIAIGIGILRLAHNGPEGTLEHWAKQIGLDAGRHAVDVAIGKVVSIPPNRLRDIGFGSFVYAALFLTEGTGLWLRKKWAEWFTAIITGSLVPFEAYELFRHATVGKAVGLVVNITIVVYLLVRINKDDKA